MPRPLKPIPRNIVQVQQAQINAYLPSQGKPDSDEGTVFSHNRARDLSFKGNKIKDISVGLEDIDSAIQYYFDNVIRPNVIQNNNRVAVPVIFGDAERWKSVQNDGFYRDKDGKIMAPLIMYKRTNVEKNRTLGNKIDGNKSHLFNVFETRYNAKNFYDKFNILTNRIPSKQYYVSVVPDYVTVTYECVLFTNFVEQNNKLIEAIEFASDSYWGDFNRWHFRTKIDTFAVTNIIEQGADRAARTNFTMTLNGYLVSDTINKQMANTDMFYSPSQIIFGLETVDGDVDETFNASSQIAASQVAGSTSFIGGGTNITNNTTFVGGGASLDSDYLNTNVTKVAAIVTANTATFITSSIKQPNIAGGSTLPATSVSNFVFYINGQNIPISCITSLTEGGGSVLAIFNTGSIGYSLVPTDEVAAVGKFI
jgi:hypothetical protein